ncbi:hypothetical protein V8C86DRAFT_2468070 [Haematococcus lacustris]
MLVLVGLYVGLCLMLWISLPLHSGCLVTSASLRFGMHRVVDLAILADMIVIGAESGQCKAYLMHSDIRTVAVRVCS